MQNYVKIVRVCGEVQVLKLYIKQYHYRSGQALRVPEI